MGVRRIGPNSSRTGNPWSLSKESRVRTRETSGPSVFILAGGFILSLSTALHWHMGCCSKTAGCSGRWGVDLRAPCQAVRQQRMRGWLSIS